MTRKERTGFKSNVAVVIAAVIAMFIMAGVFATENVSAAEGQISVIKINGTTAKVTDPDFFEDYYYIFAVVDSSGNVMTEISGDYGNLSFTRGVSDPKAVDRAINPTMQTEYDNSLYVVGLPDGAKLEVIGVRVRQKRPDRMLMPIEAGMPENSGAPYPTIDDPTYHDDLTCIHATVGHILLASFRLVDDNGNPVTNSGTYGGITFVDGVTAEGDQSRKNENIEVSEGSTYPYPPGDYWSYLMGNDDIFIITNLPAGVHIENVAHFKTDVCGPMPPAPIIKEYPRDPEQSDDAEYRVRHWLPKSGSTDEYELKDVDILKAPVGSEVTASPKDYTGYRVNDSKSNPTGNVIAAKTPDYPLILNLYYDKLPPAKYRVEFYFEQPDGNYVLDGHKDGDTYTYEAYGPVGEDPDIPIKFFGSDYSYNADKSTSTGLIKADGSLVLKLYYDLPKATLSYDLDGAEGEVPSQTVINGGVVTVADPADYDIEYPGYTFSGWYEYDGSDNIYYYPGDTIELYGDKELCASWEWDPTKAYYYINHLYENDEGKYEIRDWETEWLIGTIGEEVTATPNQNNQYYEYYPTHPQNKASGTVTEDPQLELNLYYKQVKYTLSYDGNGATGGTAPESASATYEGEVTVADNTFEKDGHEFIGWKDQHGNDYSAGSKISLDEDKTLYAQWNKVDTDANYTVEHYKENLDGEYDKADTEHHTGDVGETAKATPKNYDHYKYDDSQGNPEGKITDDGKLVLKLYYKLDEHTLTYDGNDADSGTMDSKTAKYESKFNLAPNAFVREGYEFIGWNTTKEGGGKEYADKAEFTLSEDTKLYAQWKKLDPVEVASPSIEKVLKITDLDPEKDETFEFTLTADPDNPKTPTGLANKATIEGEGKASLAFGSKISFDKAGEYTFSIKETKGNAEGYTYDETEHLWKVKVSPGSGSFVISENTLDGAAVTSDSSVKFENTYTKKEDEPTPDPEPDTHQIVYKLNGGTYKGSPDDIVETHKVGSVIKVHPAPDEREGYTFAYWKGSKYQPGDSYTVKEDHTFTAVWTKNEPEKEPTDKEESPEKEPTNKEDPGKGKKGSTSSDDTGKKTTDRSAKTGDDTDLLACLLMLLISMAAVPVIGSNRIKQKR